MLDNKILPFYWWLVNCSIDSKMQAIFYCFDFRKSGVEEVKTVLAYSNIIFPVFKKKFSFSRTITNTIGSGALCFQKIINDKEFIDLLDNKIFNNSEDDSDKILLFGQDNLILNNYSLILFQGNVKSLLYSKYPAFDFDKASFIVNRVFSGLENYEK